MKCQKDKEHIETNMNLHHIDVKEQECHIWLDKTNNICHIDSSWVKYNTKLLNNPFFVLKHTTLGIKKNIIQVKGTLPIKAITIRKKGVR